MMNKSLERKAKGEFPKRPDKGTTEKEEPPRFSQGRAKGNYGITASEGSVAVGGDIRDGSRVITFQNVNIVVAGERSWKLVGGGSLPSEEEMLSGMAEDLTEVLTQKAEQFDATKGAYSGPVLLIHLLKNYIAYQRQRPKGAIFSASIPTLRCFDQEDVKARIRADSSVRVIELSGPSGIGKTHLLKALSKGDGLETEEKEVWKYAYVSPEGDFTQIIDGFIAELGSSHQPSSLSPSGLAECLMDIYSRKHIRHVLFMLDSVDDLDDTLLLRLVGDEGPAGQAVRDALPFAPDLKLRLVVASRRPRLQRSLLSEHKILGVRPIQMDALEIDDIQLMLSEKVSERIKGTSDPSRIEQMAQQIFGITGGHPGAISLILRELIDANFGVAPSQFTDRFLDTVLSKVQQDIVGDLTLMEYLVLNVLSVFRFFDVGSIRQLMQRGLLPGNLLEDQEPTGSNIRCWLDTLCETPALIRRDIQDPPSHFTVHPVLQHVLPMDLEVNSPRVLYSLHREIYGIYDQALRERDPSGIRLQMSLRTRSVYTVQAFYHAAQAQLIALQSELEDELLNLSVLVKDYWDLYIGSYNDEQGEYQLDQDPFMLRDQWKKDTDLHVLLKRLSEHPDQPTYEQIGDIFERSP